MLGGGGQRPQALREDHIGGHQTLVVLDVLPRPLVERAELFEAGRGGLNGRARGLARGGVGQLDDAPVHGRQVLGCLGHPVRGALAGGDVRLLRPPQAPDFVDHRARLRVKARVGGRREREVALGPEYDQSAGDDGAKRGE